MVHVQVGEDHGVQGSEVSMTAKFRERAWPKVKHKGCFVRRDQVAGAASPCSRPCGAATEHCQCCHGAASGRSNSYSRSRWV